jgi:CubicO group peptidase (beta-lactamase class C family)
MMRASGYFLRFRSVVLSHVAVFLITACGGGGGGGGGTQESTSGSGTSGGSGTANSSMPSFDAVIPALMQRWGLPGAAVAVTKDGQLILAKGYGVSNRTTGAAVQSDTLFRIASVTKPITATCVMKLIEDGRLTLDTPAFPLLSLGTPTDSRINQITIRHLLEHSGGWDSGVSGDPMFNVVAIARAMAVQSPPDPTTIIKYMLGKSLDFTPGSKYVYSNFGYLVLGRVIEKITGQNYDTYAKSLLAGIGITRMRLAHSLPSARVVGEATYYDAPGTALADSVFDSAPGKVPWPDGGFAIEAMDSHGGWLASAVDLVTFGTALDGNASHANLLSSASLASMLAKPAFAGATASSWYGKGWNVNQYGNYWHFGSLPGTISELVVTSGGYKMAFIANMRSETDANGLMLDIDNTLWAGLSGVTGL